MGLTLLAIIYSPWGKRSGAHMNPALTLTSSRLGKINRWDALFYVLFQFTGGVAGVLLCVLAIGSPIRDIKYVATVPGVQGTGFAFWAEFLISFGLMTTVLVTANSSRLSRHTPVLCATLLTIYITVEAPLSGMSMNPARTFGSALPSNTWTAIWVYFSRAHRCYVRGRRVVSPPARRSCGVLRETSPPQRPTLYLPLNYAAMQSGRS